VSGTATGRATRTKANLRDDQAFYVYGVVAGDSTEIPGDLAGLDDAPVQLIEYGEIAAVVGVIDLERPPGRRQDLMAHSKVVDALAAAGPVVPVRFGSMIAEAAGVVEEFLEPDHDRFAQLLADLTGRAQFNLRASYNEPAVLAEVVAENPEIAELREHTRDVPEDVSFGERVRLGELVAHAIEAKREYDGQIILDTALPHVAAHQVREGSGVDHLLDAAFLVDDDRRMDFENALEAVAEAMHERARLRLYGPVAPYDFVEG
jgi:hypothetical protein